MHLKETEGEGEVRERLATLDPEAPVSPLERGATKWVGAYGGVKDQSPWVRLRPEAKCFRWMVLEFNPVVTFASLLLILGFVTWAMVSPEQAGQEFTHWKSWVGLNFTWLYIGAQDGWALFVGYLYFSKYGSIRLGREDSRPEYNDLTWFCMLFSCGLSTGLFFYGVSEPIYHYTGENRYSADSSLPDNSLAQQAINLCLYHWGIHAWTVYTLLALLLALMAHREGLPLTMKSCFYPLIGDKIFGWPGDLVDVVSVLATVWGICTGLGVGTIQINQGLHLMNPNITEGTRTQVIIIWTITIVATVSVLTGVKYGIRRISEFCFCCGCGLMAVVFLMDETVYLLNLYVQSMGYYASSLIQLGSHTDAFEQLGSGAGGEERGRYLPDAEVDTAGPQAWMNDWTLFYWGWWIAWCPFVGMFIAKISVGRTVKEFIFGVMVAPVVYVSMWFIMFGGSGLRMEREAANTGLCCHNLEMSVVHQLGHETPGALVNTDDRLCGAEDCSPCSSSLVLALTTANMTYGAWSDEVNTLQESSWWGVTTADRSLTRLSCRRTEEMWFDMMMSYGDLGPFLSGFSLIALILYFVTSADSGCLVIGCLASNGHDNTPRFQRVLWALVEGLAATSLLVAGGKQVLVALQAMIIATGLVFNIFMCLGCVAIWRALQVQAGERDPRPREDWPISLLDPFFSDPFPKVLTNFTTHMRLFCGFLRNVLLAPWTLARVAGRLHGPTTFWPVLISLGLLFTLAIILPITQVFLPGSDGAWALGIISYGAFVFGTSCLRGQVRDRLELEGSTLEDFLLTFVLYPSVVLQLDLATATGLDGVL